MVIALSLSSFFPPRPNILFVLLPVYSCLSLFSYAILVPFLGVVPVHPSAVKIIQTPKHHKGGNRSLHLIALTKPPFVGSGPAGSGPSLRRYCRRSPAAICGQLTGTGACQDSVDSKAQGEVGGDTHIIIAVAGLERERHAAPRRHGYLSLGLWLGVGLHYAGGVIGPSCHVADARRRYARLGSRTRSWLPAAGVTVLRSPARLRDAAQWETEQAGRQAAAVAEDA